MLDLVSVRQVSPVFVGRAKEIAALRSALADAAAGNPSTVVVGGEAGMGKTRLIEHFASLLTGRSIGVTGMSDTDDVSGTDPTTTTLRTTGGTTAAPANTTTATATTTAHDLDRARVLIGACVELGDEGMAFAPFAAALRVLLRDEPAAFVDEGMAGVSRLRELSRLLPELTDGVSAGAAGWAPDGEELDRARLFDAVLGLLEDLGSARPLVLVLEDLHWADRSTRDLLAFLTRSLRRTKVLIVGTYRTDDLHRGHPLRAFLAELDRIRGLHRVELAPFTAAESARQISAILDQHVTAEFTDRVFARAEGNPFFTEELACELRTDGTTPWMSDSDDFMLSETLRDLLLIRVERLPEPTQRLLRLLAAGVPPVDHVMLLKITGMSEDELNELLRPAFAANVLVPGDCGVSYRFRHALMRAAVHDELLPGEHSRLHRRYAELLEAEPSLLTRGRGTVELAHHWYAARDNAKAYSSARSAASAAAERWAYTEEHRMLERALELWDQLPEPRDDYGDLLYATASAANLAGDPHRSLFLTERALKAIDPSTCPDTAALLHGLRSSNHRILGRSDGLADLYAANELVTRDECSSVRIRIANNLSIVTMVSRGPVETALEFADETSALAEKLGSDLYRIHADITRGTVLAERVPERAAEGIALLGKAIEDARDLGDPAVIGRAYINMSAALAADDRHAEAAATAKAGLDALDRQKVRRRAAVRGVLWGNAITSLMDLGRWDEAAEAAERGLDVDAPGVGGAVLHETRADIAVLFGDVALAQEHLAIAARNVSRPAFDKQYHLPRMVSEINLAAWGTKRIEDARSAFRPFREWSTDIRTSAWDAGPADVAGDGEDAPSGRRPAQDAYDAFDAWAVWILLATMAKAEADDAEISHARTSRGGVAVPDDESRANFETIRSAASVLTRRVPSYVAYAAVIEAEYARWSDAVTADTWDEAVAASSAPTANRHLTAYILFRAAETAAAFGDRETAAARLRLAAPIVAGLLNGPLSQEIRLLAMRARLDLEDSPSASAPNGEAAVPLGPTSLGLTSRELEVLALVTDGLSNKQIGERLYISTKTASVHVSNILAKLGVSGRGEAAALAHRLRVFED